MLVTLINPPALTGKYNYSAFSHPPLGLAYIAASLRQAGYGVHVIDAVGEAISRFASYPASKKFMLQGLSAEAILDRVPRETGIIGFSCMFTHTWPVVRNLINQTALAFPEVLFFAGGEHPTALPELCLNQTPLTACVLGEGEQTMVEMIQAIADNRSLSTITGLALKNSQTGEIIINPRRPPIMDLDRLPWPAWDLIPWREYRLYEGPVEKQTMPMLGTRGCPYQCAFCTACHMWGRTWRTRSPASITKELQYNISTYHISEFQFFDISSLVDRNWIKALCEQFCQEKLEIKWHLPVGNRAEKIDDQTAWLLVRSGCGYIQFAPESGSPRLLKQMNKKINLKKFQMAVKAAKGAGMRVCALFIIGYPGETLSDIRQ
ncbi:MAG: B12-binding domain-containing radical SAM protein, partial [Desulfobacterales bacterium]